MNHFAITFAVNARSLCPQVTRVKVRLAAGVKVASLANRADDLQVSLALDAPPLIRPGRGFVVIDLPRANRQTILLLDALERGVMKTRKSPMAFPVGVGIEGEAILSDFCDSNTCHILVAGTSGSGKSEWLKALVASLVRWNPPEHLRLALVDPKVLTFSSIADSPYLWRPVAIDLGSALGVLRDAISEMDRRYRMLAQEGLVSLHDRFQEGRTDVPFLILVFDEFADLILIGRNEKREFEEMVARLAGKGRAAAIHLVLATQRPDRTVVTGLIKSNLPMKVCLRVANATNSQIALGEPGAESLLGKGDLLCDLGRGPVRAQSYFIPQADFVRALGAHPLSQRAALRPREG
jgi:S-DNA-T family DNA segregation ATPase FtsK/SpoIIIE